MHATLDFALSPTHNIAGDPADVAATVVREFQDALDACVRGWKQGNDTVLIADNLHEAFGELVLQYFERTLVNEVGGPINFTVLDSAHGQHTLVQMPKAIHQELVNQLELKNVSAAIPFTSDTTKVKPTAPAVKKAPRPMNCWLIFRDAMHKQLKAENPKLTVQQICKSTFFYSSDKVD